MADMQPIGFGAAFVRGLAHLLDLLSLGVGFLLPLTDERRQTLADKIMGTIVIYEGKTGSTDASDRDALSAGKRPTHSRLREPSRGPLRWTDTSKARTTGVGHRWRRECRMRRRAQDNVHVPILEVTLLVTRYRGSRA
jgi:hypothetical protein